MKHYFWISGLIIFVVTALSAQSYFGSEPGSSGIYQYVTGVRGQGMGDVALALPDSVAPSAYGITQWQFLRHSRIVVGARYYVNQISVDDFNFTRSSAGLNQVVIVVPLISYKWHLGFTLSPYSINNIAFNRQYTQSVASYREVTSRQANLNKAQFATVWAPEPEITVGVVYNYYFGINITEYKILFDEGNYNDIRIRDEYRISGRSVGFYLGMNAIPRVRLTGFVEVAPNASARRIYSYSYAGKLTVSENEAQEATIPAQLGGGIAIQLKSGWILAADGVYQNWERGFGILAPDVSLSRNWYHLGIGTELAASRERHASLLRKLDWRLGVSLQKTGYQYLGNDIYRYALHLGTGIPFFFGYNRLDVAIRFGSRGDRNLKIVRENFIELNFGVSLGEKWFQRIR